VATVVHDLGDESLLNNMPRTSRRMMQHGLVRAPKDKVKEPRDARDLKEQSQDGLTRPLRLVALPQASPFVSDIRMDLAPLSCQGLGALRDFMCAGRLGAVDSTLARITREGAWLAMGHIKFVMN
jgi:hypothetical protein